MLNKGLESLAEGEKPLLHSDQGWHYRIKSYQSALADRGLVQSMSRKGNCLDNAVMDNFFGHLKEEMYYRRDYRNVEELENAVNEYITYWNQKRIKLSLGGLSPVEYRTEYQKAGFGVQFMARLIRPTNQHSIAFQRKINTTTHTAGGDTSTPVHHPYPAQRGSPGMFYVSDHLRW